MDAGTAQGAAISVDGVGCQVLQGLGGVFDNAGFAHLAQQDLKIVACLPRGERLGLDAHGGGDFVGRAIFSQEQDGATNSLLQGRAVALVGCDSYLL